MLIRMLWPLNYYSINSLKCHRCQTLQPRLFLSRPLWSPQPLRLALLLAERAALTPLLPRFGLSSEPPQVDAMPSLPLTLPPSHQLRFHQSPRRHTPPLHRTLQTYIKVSWVEKRLYLRDPLERRAAVQKVCNNLAGQGENTSWCSTSFYCRRASFVCAADSWPHILLSIGRL